MTELRHRVKLLLIAGFCAIGLVGGAAQAADLAPVAPLPALAYFSWTGCYAGGNAGGLWAYRQWSDQIPGDPLFGTDFGRYTQGACWGACREAAIIRSAAGWLDCKPTTIGRAAMLTIRRRSSFPPLRSPMLRG